MTARISRLFVLGAAAALTACSSLLVKSTPAPVYYQLHYEPLAVSCSKHFSKGIRIANFVTSTPYNRTDMVVVEKGQQVNFSDRYQWVAAPGTLLADALVRDLSGSKLFPQVVSSASGIDLPYELTGNIFTFAWEKRDSAYRAVLDIEISVIEASGHRRVILGKKYHFQSVPVAQNSSENFASAMSSVVRDFSQALLEDLCEAAGKS